MKRNKGWLMASIREAVNSGRLKEPFGHDDLVGIGVRTTTAGAFPYKHRVGNPGGYTEHFVLVSPGLFRVKRQGE